MDYLKNKVLLGCKRVEMMMEVKTRPMKELDRIDRNILNELQKDGRISNVELSKRVGLSPTPCLERVRRLERQGYITGYTAILNPQFMDASLLVFVEITLNRGAADVFEQFNKAVQELEEIQECHLVSGDFDYLLKTRVSDMSAYRRLLGETLLRLPGVNDTRTYVVMEDQTQIRVSLTPGKRNDVSPSKRR
jgi:Lrp/AsnC family leucine-responsive transcriptional regulator